MIRTDVKKMYTAGRPVGSRSVPEACAAVEPDTSLSTRAFVELIRRLGGEVRVAPSALTGLPDGWTLVVEDDPLTGERVFRLAPVGLDARVARLLDALT